MFNCMIIIIKLIFINMSAPSQNAFWLHTVTLLQVAVVEVVVEAGAREPAASHAFMPRHWCQRILDQVGTTTIGGAYCGLISIQI